MTSTVSTRIAFLLLSNVALAAIAQTACAADYKVDSQKSLVLIHVSRAGVARALGHNHLISAREVTGTARYLPADLGRSQFSLQLPVMELMVDDTELRRTIGGKYEKPVSESARDGTRKNMLSEKVLDAPRFNSIELQGSWHSGTAESGKLMATINLRGVQREMLVPVQIEIRAGKLTARGKFQLSQSHFGVKPFTALGGTLAVGDTIEIEYKMVLNPA